MYVLAGLTRCLQNLLYDEFYLKFLVRLLSVKMATVDNSHFSISSKLSKNAKMALYLAHKLAVRAGTDQVELINLFFALILNKKFLSARVLEALNLSVDKITKSIGLQDVDGIVDFLEMENASRNYQVYIGEPEGKKQFSPFDSAKFDIAGIKLSLQVQAVLNQAFQIANKHWHVYVGTEHLMVAILSLQRHPWITQLKSIGLDVNSFVRTLSEVASYPPGLLSKPMRDGQRQEDESFLASIGVDLVERAHKKRFDPVIGREEEITQIVNILSRRKKNNPLIVGEAGVGKTALVEGLAQRIADGLAPSSLANFRIISVDIASIIAGSKMRGDVEEKMLQLVSEVIKATNVILFIDEIQSVLISGIHVAGADISGILKPALLQENFRCIGTSTLEDYNKYFEEDSALTRRFQTVFVEEPSIEDTIEILRQVKPVLEKHHNMKISDDALVGATKLSDRFVSDRRLPDKAIDLLDEATATRRLEVEHKHADIVKLQKILVNTRLRKDGAVRHGNLEFASKLKKEEELTQAKIRYIQQKKFEDQEKKEFEVGVDVVKKVIAKWTGIPIATIDRSETQALLNLEKKLSSKIIGQNEAVKAVSNAIKRARVGISSEERPWASLLFLGPTGVGKSELAKVLTKELFGDEKRLVQIDMSELMEQHSISKLIGSPPGYIGFKDGGQLTQAVRKYPHCVVLFDEIEKAHDSVLNLLLQILEYGHLTDAQGHKVNFKNTVIILTSNIGVEEIQKNRILGFVKNKAQGNEQRSDKEIEVAYDAMKSSLMAELRENLRPELMNRLDDIVIFRALTRADAKEIVKILLSDLNLRLKENGVEAKLDNKAINLIVKKGFSEEYGARPLRRLIQDKLESLLADHILVKGLEGNENDVKVVEISVDKAEFVLK